MTGPLVRTLFVWILAIAPVLMGLSAKFVIGIWGLIATMSIMIPPGNRSIRSLFLYIACITFTSVDYLSTAPDGFVGGAPPALAFYPIDVILIAVILFGILERRMRWPRGFFGLLLILGGLWTMVAFSSVLSRPIDVAAMQQALVMPRGMLAAFLVWSLCRERRDIVFIGIALSVGLGFQVIIGALQHFRGDVTGLYLLGEAPADQLSKYIAYGVQLWRSGGTLGHPNVFASYLVAIIPAVAAAALYWKNPFIRAGLLLLAAAGLSVLIWTYSRGAWLAISMVALYVCATGIRSLLRGYRFAAILAVVIVVLLIGYPSIRQRVEQTERSATDVRIELLSIASHMVSNYPFTGVGLSQVPSRLPEFDPELTLELFRHPVHNIVMLDFAEMGVPGGIASLFLFGTALIGALIKIRSGIHKAGWTEWGISLGIAALILHNLVDWTLRVPSIMLLFWILSALADSGGRDIRNSRS